MRVVFALDTPVCRDPDDDWVLATAASGQADLIVTGDHDLLAVKRFREVEILSPRQFITLIAGGKR